MADEVTVVPITLGSGFPLFAEPLSQPMRLTGVRPFSSGMARLSYDIPK